MQVGSWEVVLGKGLAGREPTAHRLHRLEAAVKGWDSYERGWLGTNTPRCWASLCVTSLRMPWGPCDRTRRQ